MSKFILTLVFFASAFFSFAQNKTIAAADSRTRLSDGAQLLFKDTKSKLNIEEKNKLFNDLNLQVSKNKNEFIADGFSIDAKVYPTDINKDRIEEIFVVLASTALYGNVGETFFLYIKNTSGDYKRQPKLGGGIPTILKTKNLGYNDILIGLPGYEFPAWRWNGTNYAFYKNIKDDALKNNSPIAIEKFSRSYTSTIKD